MKFGTCICENSKYLKSVPDTLVIMCVEIISIMDTVSRKMTNTIATNVMSTATCNSKKVDIKLTWYVLHALY